MANANNPEQIDSQQIKQCCARLYESDAAKMLLGESFHPGGFKLTERLGDLLQLGTESRVLDVACGKGASAIFLTQRFGCEVIGIDYSGQNVDRANQNATVKGLGSKFRFQRADADALPFPDASFDAIICECAFCTFPDKTLAAREFARVLRPGGRFGLSDLTRAADLPKELDTLLAWIACIGDAQTVDNYSQILHSAGLDTGHVEPHDGALLEMALRIQGKLLAADIMSGLKKIDLAGIDMNAAKKMASAAIAAIKCGKLGYSLIVAKR